MKRLLLVAGLLVAIAAYAATSRTQEVLVLTATATSIPRIPASQGLEILNLGPNAIWCAIADSTKAVVNKSRKIAASGGSWSAAVPGNIPVYCIVSSADQVTGAATIVTEAP